MTEMIWGNNLKLNHKTLIFGNSGVGKTSFIEHTLQVSNIDYIHSNYSSQFNKQTFQSIPNSSGMVFIDDINMESLKK
jgi:GTPase SAR1 family protein